jgi:anthranilate phosphoribosyltransferase
MKNFLLQLADQKSLTEEQMKEAFQHVLEDEVTESEIAAFLMGLKSKGETVDEIAGIVRAMKNHTYSFKEKYSDVLDNCGTGGDGSSSFNISTTSAFVIAGAGITVGKHGNRSISSKTGSADVLEALGVKLDLPLEKTEEILKEIGIAFLYAPHVHPKLKRVNAVRKQLKIPTVFNYIGPLTNPIDLDYQMLGVNRRDILEPIAEVLKTLGRRRATVLNGAGNMDEASLQGENHLAILDNGIIRLKTLTPEDVGLSRYDNKAIRGGDAKQNAEILLGVLKGEKGAYRDTVLLNAGIGIFTANKAESILEGVEKAREIIDSGAALEKLTLLIEKSSGTEKEAI